MRMDRLRWRQGSVWAAAWLALAASAPAAPGGKLILDESAYCRAYYQFGWDRVDARALKEQGEKLLSRNRLRRLERETKRFLADRHIDWEKEDWRDHAVKRYIAISHTMEGSADRLRVSRTPPPPPDCGGRRAMMRWRIRRRASSSSRWGRCWSSGSSSPPPPPGAWVV